MSNQEDLDTNKKTKFKPKRTFLLKRRRDIQKNLTEVYLDGDGKIPDLSKLDKSQRPFWKTVIYIMIGVSFVLLAAAIAGFFVFSNLSGDSFTNEKVFLKIEPPLTISSGEDMPYTIMITNREKVNLYNLKLELFYPDNFEYVKAEPIALGEKSNLWDFSTLKIGETQKITLTGRIVAAIGSTQTIKGILTFKPANLNANFTQDAIVDAVVSSSVINFNVSGPEKVMANQKAQYIIKYKNVGQYSLSNLQVVVDYPAGFVFSSADPAADKGSNSTWSIAKLPVDGEGQIKIDGTYSAISDGGNQAFKARIQINKDGDYYPQSLSTFTTNVIKDQLSLQLVINGSAEDQPINFDDDLIYSLSYKNTGQDDLTNINITAILDSQIIDWDSLNDDNDGVVKNNSITWTGKQIPKLLKLGAGEEEVISWSIKVKPASVLGDNRISRFDVVSHIEATADQGGEFSGTSNIETKNITNAINSDLALMAAARYYNEDNVPLGSGPIQPKVGEESSYNIKLDLSNRLHDIRDLVLVATLPQTVTWSDRENHNTGDLVYDQKANKVTWSITRLIKSANNSEVTFNVTIKPKSSDLGRVLILISEINLTAKDADTGAEINKNLKAITTSFNDPILGQVSGIVE